MKKAILALVACLSSHYIHAANSDWVLSIANIYRSFTQNNTPTDTQRQNLKDCFTTFIQESVESSELQTLSLTLLFDHIDRYPHHETTDAPSDVHEATEKLAELATNPDLCYDLKTLESLIVLGQIIHTAQSQQKK